MRICDFFRRRSQEKKPVSAGYRTLAHVESDPEPIPEKPKKRKRRRPCWILKKWAVLLAWIREGWRSTVAGLITIVHHLVGHERQL